MNTVGPGRRARMLVVDDEPRNRKLLEGYLRSEGYAVTSAADGPTAVRLAGEERPDVVLLDVMMPEMTGHEVCRLLKSNAETRICQVMMVTALAGTANTVEGLDTGADDYVSKPVRRDEFLAKVRALVRVSRLLRELEDARMSLSERNAELKLKKDLAQMLVHDLRSPLAAIIGNLDLLCMGGQDQPEALIERSHSSATRMLKMILDLLDVERLEGGRLELSRERIDLAELARAAVDEAGVTARMRRVSPRLESPNPAWVEADPTLVRRVIDNLISNAISHSPSGGSVTIVVNRREEGVELAVSDSGPGVPEGLRDRIFEKYAQLEPQDAGRSHNRGLGLTFCRLAVEAHGGTIWIDSAPEGGALFRTILPEAVDAESGRRPVEAGLAG